MLSNNGINKNNFNKTWGQTMKWKDKDGELMAITLSGYKNLADARARILISALRLGWKPRNRFLTWLYDETWVDWWPKVRLM